MCMNIIDEVFTTLVEKTAQSAAPGDYSDSETGLLVCGQCGKFKQTVISVDGKSQTVGCCCECDIKAWDLEQERCMRFEIQRLREVCITDPDMREKTFSSSLDIDRLKKFQNYVENWDTVQKENLGLLFLGAPGSGKTHVAACIANALIDKGISAGILSVSALLALPIKEHGPFIQEMLQMSLLVLDDFGAERETSYASENVFNLVDNRVKSGRPMIVTTNLTMKDLNNPMDIAHQRIYQRILEACRSFYFKEASYRSDIRKRKQKILDDILGT